MQDYKVIMQVIRVRESGVMRPNICSYI